METPEPAVMEFLRPQLEEIDDGVAIATHLLDTIEGSGGAGPDTLEALRDLLERLQTVESMLERITEPVEVCRRTVSTLITRVVNLRDGGKHN